MPKQLLLILALTVVILTALATLFLNSSSPREASKDQIETAVNQANLLYNQKRITGEDLSSGPCLSNALLPGWVLDIAHRPRQSTDDLPENQCPAYLEGRAKHFVELDLEGKLIRAK